MTPTRRFFGTNLFAARRLQNIPRFWRRVAECLSSSIAIALLTFVCFRLEFGFATTAFLYLLIIILVSLRGSFLSSAVVSLIAVACLNYYFTPPLFTFRIDDWHDVVAIIAFWTTAAVITRLVSRSKEAEERIRQSEGELQQVVDVTPQLVAVFGPDRERLYANRPSLDYFGVPLKEWQSISDRFWFFHPDDRERVANDVYTGPAGDVPHEFEARLRRTDGVYRWFLFRDNPLRDEQGRITRWYLSATDIEDRKRAEENRQAQVWFLESMDRINRAMQGTNDLEQVMRDAIDAMLSIFDSDRAFLYYPCDPDAPSFEVVMERTRPGYPEARGVIPMTPDTARGFQTVLASSGVVTFGPGCDHPLVGDFAKRFGHKSSIGIALYPKTGKPWVLVLHQCSYARVWTPDERKLLEEIARRLADSLTGLLIFRNQCESEEALRQSEAYLAEAQRLSHTGSWALNADTREYTYWSEEMFRIFGVDPREGVPPREAMGRRIHPEDRIRAHSGFERSLKEKVDTSDEYRFVLPDGTVKHIHAIRHPVMNAAGVVVELMGSFMDITERKRAEEALRRSEAYLAESQRLAHTGTFVSDETTKPLYWSEELYRIYGFDPQQGLPTRDQPPRRIHPEDLDKFWRAWQRGIRDKVDTDVEYRIVLPDGTVKHVYGMGHPVLNADGELIELVGTTVDITERKLAEEALRESETRFRTFVDHAGDALFVQDFEQGTIVDVNRQACENLGYTRQELIGKTPLAFHLDSDRATVESAAERAAGETVFDRHSHRRKDGSTFPVEVHTSVVSYGGRRFLLKVARDISDRLRTEEQREKLRQLEADLAHINRVSMMGELTASLAHEIRQPIAAAITSADACLRWLMRNPPDLERARLAVARVKDDGARAADVINRLRSFYKKGTPSEREMVDVNEVIREMIVLLRNEAIRHSVSVRPELAEGIPKVIADRVQLQQVLMNLMLNALEAMQDTGGELMIRSQLKQDGQLLISVSDAGVGLPAENANRIFDAFFTTKPQGSGMGLAITRSIVESHGGRLWATANDGPGATFHFTLHTEGEAQA